MSKSRKKVDQLLDQLEAEINKPKLTVTKFAKLVGVTRATVHDWLKRKRVMQLEHYLKAVEVLKQKPT